jgi:hypothetical protein
MKLVIDSEVCESKGLTLEEFIVLYLNSKNVDISKTINSIIEKKVAGKDLFNPNAVVLSSNSRKLLEEIILDSDKTVAKNNKRLENLAEKLRELYPEGKKQGTQYYWRDSNSVIVKKLKALIKKYGDCFTDEQAINATKKYVESFNGNYQFMQLLKYFISKNVVKGGEVEETSQLLSYIENAGQEDKQQLTIDWETELR